jgi:hypothetical protein
MANLDVTEASPGCRAGFVRHWSAKSDTHMTPLQAQFVIPISTLCIAFASFYINIRAAKKKVVHWKGYSTLMFLRTLGLTGIKKRARLIWMKEGYDEAEALILAKYQSRAMFWVFFGCSGFSLIAVNLVKH